MEALQTALVVVGLSGLGLLWVAATVGALGIVWDGVLAPMLSRLRRKG